MRVRHILLLTFLLATLIPSLFFGFWAYRDGVSREFADVEDRHLLLARNLGNALERYEVDLVATIETIAKAMLSDQKIPNLNQLLSRLNLKGVSLVDKTTGTVIRKVELTDSGISAITTSLLRELNALAVSGQTRFSPVRASSSGENSIYTVRDHGKYLAVAQIGTGYFVQLGKSISFGTKGHAAIVDREGNVLAHPLDSWVAERKNIAKVSAVQRMMNGETGIEQFYSPALKGDMIAGLTSVAGPGWGVMIPQPVSELHDKVSENNKSIFMAIGLGVLITLLFVRLLLSLLSRPLEKFVATIKRNIELRQLGPIEVPGAVPVARELKEFRDSYNEMVAKITTANRKIEVLAYTDSVTKLPNRVRFQQLVEQEIRDETGRGTGGILVFVDVDDFKEVNDIYGHDQGDLVLRAFALKLVSVCRRLKGAKSGLRNSGNFKPGIVSRIGGDEFAIVVPGLHDRDEINWFLLKLLDEISEIGGKMPVALKCSASVGCARYPDDGETLEELLRHADIAMYHAKKQGKSRAQIYDDTIGSMTETEIRAAFSQAVSGNQLILEYQPKICTRRAAVASVEALVRWNHPRLGRLSPDVWLPAVTNSHLANELGNWVAETAMRDQINWRAKGQNLTVAINISSEQFANPDFVSEMIRTAKKTGIDPRRFEIEVTEDALFTNEKRAISAVRELSEFGFRISIDDFGKGYSNLTRLAQMPLDFIKLDQSIIAGAVANPKVSAILDATVAMARELGCNIVAEGIETLEYAQFATEKGANLLQGYFFAASMPAAELLDWVQSPVIDSVEIYRDSQQAEAA